MVELQVRPQDIEPRTTTLAFAGYRWEVKHGKAGPGPNHFSENNVWVDKTGKLHLKITYDGNKWNCAEVTLSTALGQGTYDFSVIGRTDTMDPNMVLGLFLYDGDKHEADVELGRWGDSQREAAQYVIQPNGPSKKGGVRRFHTRLTGTHTRHSMQWNRQQISFRSVHGHDSSRGKPIAEWEFPEAHRYLPNSQNPRVHINFYLRGGSPPLTGQEREIVIANFRFSPTRTPVGQYH